MGGLDGKVFQHVPKPETESHDPDHVLLLLLNLNQTRTRLEQTKRLITLSLHQALGHRTDNQHSKEAKPKLDSVSGLEVQKPDNTRHEQLISQAVVQTSQLHASHLKLLQAVCFLLLNILF